jgi:RNA polymerase sigma-70 factor (ECF subfamily)
MVCCHAATALIGPAANKRFFFNSLRTVKGSERASGCPLASECSKLRIPVNTCTLSLFQTAARIQIEMSFFFPALVVRTPAAATPRPGAVCFSTFMFDDAQSLARALRRRDPDLLDRLIEQYQFRLFRYLVHLTGNRERAEDFFQETWLRVLERGHQYDGKWKFEAWLFAIARNLVLDWHRRKRPQSLESLAGPDEDAPAFDVQDQKSESPLQRVLREEERAGLELSLHRVPAIYREVLVLRFQEEMQLDEIATVTGAPISTVKSRLYRGLEALKGAVAAAV